MTVYCPLCSEAISTETSQCPSCGVAYSADTRTFLTSTIKGAQQSHPEERRRQYRFYRWYKVIYYTQEAFRENYLSDISTGGIFIQTDEPLKQGEQFNLKVFLPYDETELEVLCEVAWSRQGWQISSEDRLSAGMGIKFLNLAPEDKERIIKVLNRSASGPSVGQSSSSA